MSAYLNLTIESFLKECKDRTILDKVRIAQKRQVEQQEKAPPLFRTWFQLTSIDLAEGVILKCTVPISTTLSDPWSERAFPEDKKGYDDSHAFQLKRIEEEAAKYYPIPSHVKDVVDMMSAEAPRLQLKEGEWSWGE